MGSLDFRRDIRSVGIFKKNIRDFTEREKHWGEALMFDFCQRGVLCQVRENGVDNSGDLIEGKLSNYNADKKYLLKDGREWLLEIKTCPERCVSYFTFKVHSLKSCLKQKAWIAVPKLAGYHLLKPVAIKEMIEEHKHDIYKNFSPSDLACRVFMDSVDEWLDEHKAMYRDWAPDAKRYINDKIDILVRGKDK